jgi:branched-chain amino acid transport system permease protein
MQSLWDFIGSVPGGATCAIRGGGVANFVEQVINGVTLGSMYGLIAIGYTMVYGIIGMINFAHGDVFMVGSFIALIAIILLGIVAGSSFFFLLFALLLVLVIAMLLTAVWGWTIERVAYRPLRHSFRLAPLITAIGMSIILVNLIQVLQGARPKPYKDLITGSFEVMRSGDYVAHLSYTQILIVVTTTVLMAGFTWLINNTSLGRSQRACEQDRRMASLLGVNVDRTISLTFVIGAALAAVAGFMFLVRYGQIDFFIGFVAGVKAFTAAVLGGIGSLPGAMLGGIVIGLIETLWSGYCSGEYKDVAAFSILALVLIFMPSGLLGKPEIEKV